MISLKYLSNFQRTLAILLINCEISLQLKLSKTRILDADTAANQKLKFILSDIKPYVRVITLLTEDNLKLLKQLESGLKRTINWNKYLTKTTNQVHNRIQIM